MKVGEKPFLASRSTLPAVGENFVFAIPEQLAAEVLAFVVLLRETTGIIVL